MNESSALKFTTFDFMRPQGRNFDDRLTNFGAWIQDRQDHGVYQYGRRLNSKPGPHASVQHVVPNADQRTLNFSSQDYLGLAAHPDVIDAAQRAIRDFGVHSAGSPMILGRTPLSEELERDLSTFLEKEFVLLFPTGWGAGFGAVAGIVRRGDQIIMDRLCHASLQIAAQATGAKIRKFEHLSQQALEAELMAARLESPDAGLFVMTEGLFSMDSDSPDIKAIAAICRVYDALLFIDVAHDLAAMGATGRGQLEVQQALSDVDIIMGSFSKSFAANGGFVACNSRRIFEYIKMYGNSYMFSNAMAPMQVGVVSACLKIIRSDEGNQRRNAVMKASTALRQTFMARGLRCFGSVSPIVPVAIGAEAESRLIFAEVQQRGVAAAVIEFPIVPRGSARFRLQVMASHEEDDAVDAANIIADAVSEVGGHSPMQPD